MYIIIVVIYYHDNRQDYCWFEVSFLFSIYFI